MKHIKRQNQIINQFLVGLASGAYLLTAGMIGTVWADDTEIYVADFPTGGTSNILFVLDTSGSMNTTVTGSTQTRMDAVKQGLIDLINGEGNFRMGLATFHPEYGGPINFPVSDLNASVDSSNGEVAVAIVGANNDDAEEDTATGVVTLGNENPGNPDTLLEMTDKELAVGGSAMTWASDPTAHVSVDDDEQGEGGGFNDIDSPDMDVGAVNLGIRFKNVAIPQNAVILHAEVVFETRAGSSGTTRSIIRGHDVDDAPNFASQNVVSRMSQLTSALVPWSNMPADIAGDTVRTPNIRSVVQEIVTRPGWTANNDIAIMFSASQGQREYESYDNGTDGPQLVVTYAVPGTTGISQQIVDGDNDAEQHVSGSSYLVAGSSLDISFQSSNEQEVALRFPNVNIPANATVLRADIDFVVRSERTGQADFLIHAQEAPDATHFDTGNGGVDILSRTNRTDPANAVVWSDVAAPRTDEVLQTPDLSALITEVIADSVTAWDPTTGNSNLVFIFSDNGGGSRGLCSVEGCDVESAILNVWYTLPVGSTTTSQVVGLRFNNLAIPQGSQILEAAIDFTVGSATTEDSALTIAIESSDNAAPFTNTNTDVSGRPYSGTVNWNPGPWDTIGTTQSTVNADGSAVNLASLIQPVINDPNWCGGNAVAFKIDVQTALTARRIAKSFESSAAESPVLRVRYNFDPTLATTGCVKRTFVSTITTGNNDAEENSSGSVLLNGTNLDLDTNNLVGLRFDNVQIPQGATISDTRITLTSDDDDDTGSATIKFTAQQIANAPPFTNGNSDLSNRVSGSDPSVNWSFSNEWDLGDLNTTDVDLSPTVQPVINDAAWAPGNALVFVLDTTTGERDATPVNANTPRRPAKIEIDWQANLVTSGLPALSTRDKLIETIEAIRPRGWTPTIDAMYEGAAYMLGQAVHYGKTRGAGSVYTPNLENDDPASGESQPIDTSIDDDTDDELLQEDAEHSILSHPATFSPSITPTRQGACTALNSEHPDCRNERLVGSANYISPLATGSECEKGFMIVLSDGIANRNSSSSLIDTMIGSASCNIPITTIDNNGDPIVVAGNAVTRTPSADEACGADLAKYLHDTDFITDADPLNPVLNNVRTYTIGFGLPFDTDDAGTNAQNKSAVELLKQIAAEGNGGTYGEGFFPAENASQLSTVFDTILSDIVDETTSLTSPGLSINAFNRLFNRNDVYFSSFKPSETTAWLGNMKKFQLCLDTSASPSCQFGEVIDNDSPQKPAVHLDATDPATFGTLKDDAVGFWNTDAGDVAPEVLDGGAGQKIPTWTARRAYTYTPTTAPATPSFTNVKTAGTTLEKIEPSDASASVSSDLKTRLFQTGNCGGDGSSTPGSGDDACLSEMIEWLLGKKFDGDIPRHGNDSDVDRWAFGAPMHGRPLVLTMGKIPNTGDASDPTDDDPISKIIVGANDGGLRMINEHTGQEEWIFYPQAMLGMQESLKINDVGPVQYGVDGNTSGRIYDCNSDGEINPDESSDCTGDGTVDSDDKDFVHVYAGMRRGGRNIYAVNVTPEAKLDTSAERSALDKVTPELLWRIEGGSTDYALLGQTWSNVLPTRVNGPNGPQTAVIFGGGYDPTEDNGTYRNASVGDSQGNAIYIADADTGARLFWVSGTGSGADLELAGMNTAIPATVSLIDSNSDGLTDTIYAVDLRGQVWRIDLTVAAGAISGTGGVLAVLGSDAADADKRKFFYAPAVSQVNDEQFSGGVYNLIGIISGDRSEPNGTLTMERAYAIRDYLTEDKINSSGSNYPTCNPLNAGNCTQGTALDHTTLLDVTEAVNFVLVDADTDTVTGPVDTLKESHGWYFELEGNGEKGFSAATVLGGKMFFTTYLPPDGVVINPDDSCSAAAALGTSRFYAVDFFTGAPAFEFFDGTTGYSKADRYKGLGAGPSADVVPAFFEPGTTLVVPTGAGAIPEDPDLGDTLFKSFWNQPR